MFVEGDYFRVSLFYVEAAFREYIVFFGNISAFLIIYSVFR